ncbi:hypothetical protein N7471_012419 [Penicillium samsonianum]|uniref:uncharacterized protein n=1 Tax=Penicillium samsonianum TaxID=1882272 RepID=UPI0025499F33|nr:uncharacterized protein N7471_012419 [Penicillium samsonianum]KAJ6125102.1 hypothetical protein N7471_012419 [Penicillium samsonianum]
MVRLSTFATQAVLPLAALFTQSALADSDGIVVWPPEVPNEGKGYSRDTLTTISDPLTGTGYPATLFYQPFLFEFPQQLGKYPEGTLLLVSNLAKDLAKDLNTEFVP